MEAAQLSAQNRSRRFVAVAVVAPIALLVVSGFSMNVVSRLAGNSVTSGAVEVNGWSFITTMAGVYAVIVSIILAATQRFPAERERYEPWPLTAGCAVLAGAVVAALFEPSTPWTTMVVAVAPAVIVAGFVGRRLARTFLPPQSLPVTSAPAPPDTLRGGAHPEHTPVWVGRAPVQARRVYLWLLAAPLVSGGLVLSSAVTNDFDASITWSIVWAMAMILVPQCAIFVVKLRTARVRVGLGPAGLTIRSGIGGRLLHHVELQHIASAWFTDAPKPNLMTGWGKKSSDQRLSYLTREGPALMVKLTDGTDVVVSLDNPVEAAGAINDLLDRRAVAADPAGAQRGC